MTDQLSPQSDVWTRNTWDEIQRWESASISLASSLPNVAEQYEYLRGNLGRLIADIKADQKARQQKVGGQP